VAPVALAEANPAQAPEGAIVWLSAANSTDTPSDLQGLRYVWDVGEGGVVEGRIVNVTFRTAGLRVVELTVIDDDGESSRATVDVLVINRPPVAVGNVSVTQAVVGQVVELSAAGSTDDAWDVAGLTYTWSMGDGTTLTGPTASYIYSMPGTYTLTLRVRDGDGGEGTWTATVTVLETGGGGGDGGGDGGWALYAAIGAIVAVAAVVALLLMRRRVRPTSEATGRSPGEAPAQETPGEAGVAPDQSAPPPGEG
jgi:PKD repeat protein